jgi:Lsr2
MQPLRCPVIILRRSGGSPWRRKVQTLFIEDIDGGKVEGTVRFGLEGTDYEIDLSAAHTAELHQALATYITRGRKVGGTARRAPRGRRGASDIDTTAVRAWAKEQGLTVNDRGRIPADIVTKHREATVRQGFRGSSWATGSGARARVSQGSRRKVSLFES